MRGWTLALALAAALSGCTRADEAGTPEMDPQVTVTAGDGTGAIRGVVVDAAIRPLADATVRLSPGNLTTRTTAGGGFGFSNLAPGGYFVGATKDGYRAGQTSVEVVAGVDDPPVVKVQLEADPSDQPYVEGLAYRGFIVLSPIVAILGDARGFTLSSPLLGNGSFGTEYPVGGGPAPSLVQSEFVWNPVTPLANHLLVEYYEDAEEGLYGEWHGPSNLVARFTSEELAGSTLPQNGFGFTVFAWPDDPTGTDTGVGLVAQQPFEAFTHVFHGYGPPDGWTFGTAPPPKPPRGP